MKKHVTVVGAIHIGFGVLGLIGALAVFFALNFAKGFVENEEVPILVLKFLVSKPSTTYWIYVNTRTGWRYWTAFIISPGQDIL